MKYSLIVSSDHDGGAPAERALAFANALLARGHELTQVFFYASGVDDAVARPLAGWRTLAAKHNTEIVLCSASMDRLGMAEAPAGYVIAGLGALVESGLSADRMLSFA